MNLKAPMVLAVVALSGAACSDPAQLTAAPIAVACGRLSVSGGEAGDGAQQAKRCIRDALENGAPAYLEEEITGEGDADTVEVRFDVIGKNRVRVLTGNHEQLCTGIADDGPALVGLDCEDLTEGS